MEGFPKYALAVTSVSPPLPRAAAFLTPPALTPSKHAAQGPPSPLFRFPVLALSRPSTSKPDESLLIQTKTLRVPLGNLLGPEGNVRLPTGAPNEFAQDHGLICLERTIPAEISRSIKMFAEEAVSPFKVEVFRGGSLSADSRWLDTLTEPFLARSSSSSFFCASGRQQAHARTETNEPSLDIYPDLADTFDDAVRWLRSDIDSVTRVFTREVARSPAPWPGFAMVAKEGGEIDLTVKLELLWKGKCPRYHLDRVPLRLICTYFGPSTEWLDGYNAREMDNNRSPPPACNLGISSGLKVRQASEGDVLIFKGQPPQGAGSIGVAHRSPDMEEGQRRLVLTVDIGDIARALDSS